MKHFVFAAVLIALLPLTTTATDIELVFRHGEPTIEGETAWEGRVKYASWVDDERIVFFSRGEVTCISTKDGHVQWIVRDLGNINDWSLSRETKRLAILTENYTTSIIDCNDGSTVFTADDTRMAKILGQTFAFPTRIALASKDGRLIVSTGSSYYGRNAYVLDPSYTKVLSSFDIDASPRKLSFSVDDQRVAVIADDDVLCVQDLRDNGEVFFRGTRINEEPDSRTFSIDTPFFSHFRDSGADDLVYTLDNSWGSGQAFVHNLKNGKTTSFDARNGHIELAVSFSTRRIALTGTSTHLTVFDFDGNIVAQKKHATLRRNSSVEFSPTSQRILVASWDNTISVYSISEDGE